MLHSISWLITLFICLYCQQQRAWSFPLAFVGRRLASTSPDNVGLPSIWKQVSKSHSPFKPSKPSSKLFSAKKGASGGAEDGVSLLNLVEIEEDAEFLREEIRLWLDNEYIPQNIHEVLGRHVEMVYINSRRRGVNDLGEMLMDIGTSLENVEMKEAFVGAWDVANKASDLLMLRMNRELCSGCRGTIHCGPKAEVAIPLSAEDKRTRIVKGVFVTNCDISLARKSFSTEFMRYTFLRRLLDGDIPLSDVLPPFALLLGFAESPFEALSNGKGSDQSNASMNMNLNLGVNSESYKRLPCIQRQECAAYGWEGLSNCVPDVTNLDDPFIEKRLLSDIPDEEGATDVLLECLVGVDMYKILKDSQDPIEKRRVAITKWMYVYNFLADEFAERYVPPHFRDITDEEDD